MNTYKISPSDFAYLYEECKFCYVQKIKKGIYQPSMPMPGVFSAINSRIQGNMVGKNLKDLLLGLPDGLVVSQEGWVESKIIPDTNLFIKGKYDLLVKNEDLTYTLVDLKLSQPGEDKIDKYKTQLGAYKFALENPKFGESHTISKLALLIFYPDKVAYDDGKILLDFPHTWLEVPVDTNIFLSFVKEVNMLLSGPEPEIGEACKWCNYRKVFEDRKEESVQEDLPF